MSIHPGVQKLPLKLRVCPAKQLPDRSDNHRGLLLDVSQLQPGEPKASVQISSVQTGLFAPDSKGLAHNPNLFQFGFPFFFFDPFLSKNSSGVVKGKVETNSAI